MENNMLNLSNLLTAVHAAFLLVLVIIFTPSAEANDVYDSTMSQLRVELWYEGVIPNPKMAHSGKGSIEKSLEEYPEELLHVLTYE